MKKISKVVYCDKESVIDYIRIDSGGEFESTTEWAKKYEEQTTGSVGAKAKLGGGVGFLSKIFEAEASVGASAALSSDSNKVEYQIIKNTILTDFLKSIEKTTERVLGTRSPMGRIRRFKSYKIFVKEDSLLYMVMVFPYLRMLGNGTNVDDNKRRHYKAFRNSKLYKDFGSSKGYYELVGTKGNDRVILRFNLNSFRDSYTVRDLLKMDLCIYAVKVGSTSLENLNVDKLLGMQDFVIPDVSLSCEPCADSEEASDTSQNILDVFDVLLAAVEAEETTST